MLIVLFRVTPRGAVEAGRTYGAHAYAPDADYRAAVRARLNRLFWRLQPAEVRRCFVLGFRRGWLTAARSRV